MRAVGRLSEGAGGHRSVSQCQDQPLSMNQMVACNQEVHQKYCNILCPLSLLFHSSLDAAENPGVFYSTDCDGEGCVYMWGVGVVKKPIWTITAPDGIEMTVAWQLNVYIGSYSPVV